MDVLHLISQIMAVEHLSKGSETTTSICVTKLNRLSALKNANANSLSLQKDDIALVAKRRKINLQEVIMYIIINKYLILHNLCIKHIFF